MDERHAEVLAAIGAGTVIRDQAIPGKLALHPLALEEPLRVPLSMVNTEIEHLEAFGVTFLAPVAFDNCRFGELHFCRCYYPSGLSITNCVFRGEVHIIWGGHNKSPRRILVEDSVFHDFVNFEDCWFEGPVILRNVKFMRGTNLLGLQGQPFQVTFDEPPILENVSGDLSLDRVA